MDFRNTIQLERDKLYKTRNTDVTGVAQAQLKASEAINQLIYTQVLELIPEKVDMKQVPYQKDIQPQYYVAGFNQAIDDMTERIKAKYIGDSE